MIAITELKNKKTKKVMRGAFQMATLKHLFWAILFFAYSVSASSAVNMTDVEFNSLPGGKVEMKFMFDGQAPDPKVYTIESPARIALDLNETSSKLKQKKHTLDLGNAQSVMVLESGGRTRVIVNLVELTRYEAKAEGNALVVTVGNDGVRDYLKEAPRQLEQEVTAVAESAIKSIDFRRGEKGEGRLIVELSNPNIDVDTGVEGKSIKLNFLKTALPDNLRLRYDVSDFATPVQWVKATEKGNSAQIEVQPTGEYDYLAYQAENTYVLTVKPLTLQEIEAKKREFAYVGDRLSLNFQDIDVRAVLQLIADFTDLNLVASDTVSGKITLRLQNVPWDQALDLILKTKGLDKRQEGNVLLVAPAAEIAQREQQEIKTNKQIEELAPLQTEFIRVRYAKAADLFSLLQGDGSTGNKNEPGADSSGSLLSSRATVVVDERTNSLLVTETAAKLEELRQLINLIDVPIRQVMIEARIVSATTDVSEKIGVAWGGASINTSGGGSAAGGETFVTSASQDTFMDVANGTSPVTLGRVVDLGVGDFGATNVNIGFIANNRLLDLQLSAIESSGSGEVVSQPKIITGDKQNAVIKSGQEVAYQESAANGGTTTAFKDAVLELDVTPSITPDDRVIMDIKITQDSIAGFAPGTRAPILDTTEVETQVLVNNGETVVLGGIFQTEEITGVTKTPFLGDIPYLGRLFKRTEVSNQKTEILLFITPRILADTLVE